MVNGVLHCFPKLKEVRMIMPATLELDERFPFQKSCSDLPRRRDGNQSEECGAAQATTLLDCAFFDLLKLDLTSFEFKLQHLTRL